MIKCLLPGRLYCASFRRRRDYDKLLAEGISVIVNLTRKADPPVALELGQTYIHWPLRRPCRESEVRLLGNLLAELLAAGKRVVVHCYAGRDRSGLVTVYAASRFLGITPTEALALLRESHPVMLSGGTLEANLLESTLV